MVTTLVIAVVIGSFVAGKVYGARVEQKAVAKIVKVELYDKVTIAALVARVRKFL